MSGGRPHVAPIWYVVEGTELHFTTGAGTVKGRSLVRDPRVALTVDLEEPPYAFVTVDGTVAIERDPEAMLDLSIAIARRYMGADKAEEFGRRNAVEGELLITVTPTSIVGFDDMAGE